MNSLCTKHNSRNFISERIQCPEIQIKLHMLWILNNIYLSDKASRDDPLIPIEGGQGGSRGHLRKVRM